MKSKEDGTILNAMVQVNVVIEGESSNSIVNYVHNNDALVEDYIPFNELTEDQIIKWVEEEDGGEAIARAVENINSTVERKAKRESVINRLPWKSIKSTQGDVSHT